MSASPRFRTAHAGEIAEAARLTAHSFPGSGRSAEHHEAQLGSPAWGGGADTLFVGIDGGRLVASLQAHPLRQWIGGAELTCTGIGTVAIAPTHRRRGLGAELVGAALRACRERGDVVSALYPFRTSFYQRLGYGNAGEVEQYQVAPTLLRDAPERAQIELIESAAANDEALALYHAWMRTQTGQLLRPAAVWSRITSGTDRALFGWRSESGALEGYAVVEYRTEPARYLDVDEMIWTTPAARRGLIGWLASMSDQWPLVTLRALPSHRMIEWMEEARLPRGAAPAWRLWAPASVRMLGTMFRIVDVQSAFAARSFAGDVDVTFDVVDRTIPENAGLWRVAGEQGVAHVARGATSAPTVRLDISTLSRLYIAALPASAAYEAGLLECDNPDVLPVLDRALQLPEPWTFDRF